MPKIKMMRISLDVSLESLLSAAANEGTRLDMEPFYKDVPPLNGVRVTHTEEVRALPAPKKKSTRMKSAVLDLMKAQNGRAHVKEVTNTLVALGYSEYSTPNVLSKMRDARLINRKAMGLYVITKKGAAYNG